MDIKKWMDKMQDGTIQPAELPGAYMEVSAYYAMLTAEKADAEVGYNAELLRIMEEKEISVNKAEVYAKNTEPGIRYTKLKARENGVLEAIRSLKRAQGSMGESWKN